MGAPFFRILQKSRTTNTQLSKDEIIENYTHLWQIEKAFRLSNDEVNLLNSNSIFPARKVRRACSIFDIGLTFIVSYFSVDQACNSPLL